MGKITYKKLESTLSQLGAQLNAAETHGLLTGMMSVQKPTKESIWRSAIIENLDCGEPTKKQWTILDDTKDQIATNFKDLEFNFKILLPDDENELADRLDALGYWCRGYLCGLGLIGVTKDDLSNHVVKELVSDLSQIAHVSVETDASEEDEHNFMELVEFVRVAVQNIQLELNQHDNTMLH